MHECGVMGVSLSRTEWLIGYGCWPTAHPGQGDGWGFARLSRKAALARPVTGLLIRLALAPSRSRIPRGAMGGRHDNHHIYSFAQRFRSITRRDRSIACSAAQASGVTKRQRPDLRIGCQMPMANISMIVIGDASRDSPRSSNISLALWLWMILQRAFVKCAF